MRGFVDCTVTYRVDSEKIWKVIDYLVSIHTPELLEHTRQTLKRKIKINIPFCMSYDEFWNWKKDNDTQFSYLIGSEVI